MAKINLGKVRFEYEDFTPEQLLTLKGEKGDNGKEIELTKTADGYIKWRYAGQSEGVGWTSLVALDDIKGATGEQGVTGATGTRGSRIWTSSNMTGESTTGTIFPTSGISGALVYDYCINRSTGNIYVCSKGGDADVAEWKYDSNIKGEKGDSGSNGKSVELQMSGTVLQWRQEGGQWTDLIDIATLVSGT